MFAGFVEINVYGIGVIHLMPICRQLELDSGFWYFGVSFIFIFNCLTVTTTDFVWCLLCNVVCFPILLSWVPSFSVMVFSNRRVVDKVVNLDTGKCITQNDAEYSDLVKQGLIQAPEGTAERGASIAHKRRGSMS